MHPPLTLGPCGAFAVGQLKRILTGSSVRNKSIRFCAKARNADGRALMRQSREFSRLEPGIERAELWQRIRQLKYPSNGARYRRIVWSADDDQILSRGYEKGWSGKQEAIRELLKRHPDWRPHLIWRRAAKLHLTRKTPKRGQERSRLAWSEDDDRILLNLAGYKTSRVLAKLLHRSEVAVRYRLMVLGKSSRVHLEGFARHALARDLHVASSTIQRLIAGGLLEVRDPRITRESLDNYAQVWPSRRDAPDCCASIRTA